MTRLRRSTKVLLTVALAATALSALVASSAGASIIPAKFSSTGMRMATTGITVKRAGIDPKLCTLVRATSGETYGNSYWVSNEFGLVSKFDCPSATQFGLGIKGEATYDTVANTYTLTIYYNSGSSQFSPWGSYWQKVAAKGTWVNGSGLTPSKVTFSNQLIGSETVSEKAISIDGTFNPTTLSGGLLTLSH